MLLTGFPAGPLQANCYVVAGDVGDGRADCVVIDPGQQAASQLYELLDEHRLVPVAVLLTHGHFDHVASAAQVAASCGATVYIGAGDEPMLDDPSAALSPEFRAMLPQFLGQGETLDGMRPERLVTLVGGERLEVAGVSIEVIAVPGHTPGSLTYRLEAPNSGADVLFTGDTLFAGTIGRTDLPGGSTPGILASIRAKLLTLTDATVVLPGHGPASTIGAERDGNPFLR